MVVSQLHLAVHREVVISYGSVLKCLKCQQGVRVISRGYEWLEHSPPEGEGREDSGKLSPQLQLHGAGTSVTGSKFFWIHCLMAS